MIMPLRLWQLPMYAQRYKTQKNKSPAFESRSNESKACPEWAVVGAMVSADEQMCSVKLPMPMVAPLMVSYQVQLMCSAMAKLTDIERWINRSRKRQQGLKTQPRPIQVPPHTQRDPTTRTKKPGREMSASLLTLLFQSYPSFDARTCHRSLELAGAE